MAASTTDAVFGEFDGIILTRDQFEQLQTEMLELSHRAEKRGQIGFWCGFCAGLVCGAVISSLIFAFRDWLMKL